VPLISSTYRAPLLLRQGDIHTIAQSLFRRVRGVSYSRERITTPDHDFLDIDWLHLESPKSAVLIHGLEASSQTSYIRGMAKALHQAGYQIAVMNLRGCSGELNLQLRAYHSGETDDVETVIRHVLIRGGCEELVLIGFSLGGNLILKYLGESGVGLHPQIKKAVALSVPCDLNAGATHLDSPRNFIYRNRFLRTLKHKALLRIRNHHFQVEEKKLLAVSTLREYDDVFTSPLFGFDDAGDYYRKCSSKQFIKDISIPTLILTAKDDPFFTEACIPFDECRNHPLVFLETPKHGGHVGFISDVPWGNYYSEKRTVEFCKSH
jgi:uncharacterized protein